jgi:hypothetical protein
LEDEKLLPRRLPQAFVDCGYLAPTEDIVNYDDEVIVIGLTNPLGLPAVGRIVNIRTDDLGEPIYSVALRDDGITPDGFYYARSFELREAN